MNLFRWGARPTSTPDDKPDTPPFGLNPETLSQLDELSREPRYRIFTRLLQEIAEDRGVNLLHYKDEGDFRYWQGYISALRDTQRLIPDLVDRYVRTQREQSERADKGNGEPDRRTFYGSPWWDALFPGK
jgi:hypothetical protein